MTRPNLHVVTYVLSEKEYWKSIPVVSMVTLTSTSMFLKLDLSHSLSSIMALLKPLMTFLAILLTFLFFATLTEQQIVRDIANGLSYANFGKHEKFRLNAGQPWRIQPPSLLLNVVRNAYQTRAAFLWIMAELDETSVSFFQPTSTSLQNKWRLTKHLSISQLW